MDTGIKDYGLDVAEDTGQIQPLAGALKTREFLLIEDSKTVRGVLQRILKKTYPGCVVREAEEGRSAIKAMSRGRVDMIITDLEMPGMSGVSFLDLLSRNPTLAKKPVIVLSGSITPALEKSFEGSKTVKLLRKPASGEVISQTISDLLG